MDFEAHSQGLFFTDTLSDADRVRVYNLQCGCPVMHRQPGQQIPAATNKQQSDTCMLDALPMTDSQCRKCSAETAGILRTRAVSCAAISATCNQMLL